MLGFLAVVRDLRLVGRKKSAFRGSMREREGRSLEIVFTKLGCVTTVEPPHTESTYEEGGTVERIEKYGVGVTRLTLHYSIQSVFILSQPIWPIQTTPSGKSTMRMAQCEAPNYLLYTDL